MGACLALLGMCLFLWHQMKGRRKSKVKIQQQKATPVMSPQLEVAIRKAREFVEDLHALASAFVDNRQVVDLQERYASAFTILQKFDCDRLDVATKAAIKSFVDIRETVDEMNRAFIVTESVRCGVLCWSVDFGIIPTVGKKG